MNGGVGVGFVELVPGVLPETSLTERVSLKTIATIIPEMKGLVDSSLMGPLPEDCVDFADSGLQIRLVFGKVGDEVGLGMGFDEVDGGEVDPA